MISKLRLFEFCVVSFSNEAIKVSFPIFEGLLPLFRIPSPTKTKRLLEISTISVFLKSLIHFFEGLLELYISILFLNGPLRFLQL